MDIETTENESGTSTVTGSPAKGAPLKISETEWPKTRMPDPIIPNAEPETDAEDDSEVASTIDLPGDINKARALLSNTKVRKVKNKVELKQRTADVCRLEKHIFDIQQGPAKIANSAEQVGIAMALHNSDESQYLKWKIAVEGNYLLKPLLEAYDKKQLDYALLTVKCAGLESDNLALSQTLENIIPELVEYRLGNYDEAKAITDKNVVNQAETETKSAS